MKYILGIATMLIFYILAVYTVGYVVAKNHEPLVVNNKMDLSDCQYIQTTDNKILLCFDEIIKNGTMETWGSYSPSSKVMFILNKQDEATVQHEVLHHMLYKYADKDLNNADIQHAFIKEVEDLEKQINTERIKRLDKSLNV